MSRPAARRDDRRLVGTVVALGALTVGTHLGLALGVRAALDRHDYVSELRLQAAMSTFRPEPHPGLSQALGATAFDADRNPQTEPEACAALTSLATGPAADGRSWTGRGDGSYAPVTLLTVRFADAGAARAELDRKRWAMLRCTSVAVTFPPFDAPATTYRVGAQHWLTSAVGDRTRWSLDGGGRHFDFDVVRYGNTLTWTYDDAEVSTPANRAQVARDLVDRLRELADQ